uniref:MS149 n=1 Tax=Microscilla sp. PRE1 TaxID=155537 RepID=Q93P82_9BACT|nr:MS149 [Microscilla sp. PRE1]AAK62871.1 MS149 [Microscilla sp. PRE1]
MKFKYDYREGQIYLIRFADCHKVGYSKNLHYRIGRYEKKYEEQKKELLWLEQFDYVFLALLAEHVLCQVFRPYRHLNRREWIHPKISEVEIMQCMEIIADAIRQDFANPQYLNWYKCGMRDANKKRIFEKIKEACNVILDCSSSV